MMPNEGECIMDSRACRRAIELYAKANPEHADIVGRYVECPHRGVIRRKDESK